MKKAQKPLKNFGYILITMLVYHSCGVYYKAPISLDEAVRQGGKVKVRTDEGKKIKFKKINQEDGQFYGNKMKAGEWVQVPLSPDDVSSVLLKNKKASTWVTVLSVGVPITAIVIFLATADFGIGCIWCGGY